MKRFYKILSLIISLIVVYFLLRQVSVGDIQIVLTNIKLEFLFAATFIYIGMNFGRVYRFYFLLREKINFLKLFNIGFAHALISGIMPARMGELSYIYYIRKSGKVDMGSNLASLFVSRVFDTLAVIVLMLLSLMFISQDVSNIQQVIILSLIGLVLVLALFVALIIWQSKIIWLLSFIFSLFRLNNISWGNKLLLKIQEAIISVGQVRQPKLFLQTISFTALIWMLNSLMFLAIALGFGLEMNFWQAVFIGGLPALAGIIPFYTVGNVGLFEGSAVLGLVLLGFNKEIAIGFSFILHATQILIALIPGIISYIILSKKVYKSLNE